MVRAAAHTIKVKLSRSQSRYLERCHHQDPTTVNLFFQIWGQDSWVSLAERVWFATVYLMRLPLFLTFGLISVPSEDLISPRRSALLCSAPEVYSGLSDAWSLSWGWREGSGVYEHPLRLQSAWVQVASTHEGQYTALEAPALGKLVPLLASIDTAYTCKNPHIQAHT